MARFHFFISHASEDKIEIAKPLAEALISHKFCVWYDEFIMRPGESVREKIDFGISNSLFGVIIISKHYFNKDWAKRELNAFVAKETILGKKAIIPIWHKITAKFIANESPILSDYFSINSNIGIDKIVESIFTIFGDDIKSDKVINANQHVTHYHKSERFEEKINAFDQREFTKFCSYFDGTKYKGYTVTIFDVDKLTSINKKFSVRVGNYVLSMVFKILKQSARDKDYFCRCGDDTFCLITPDIDENVSWRRVEKMLASVETFDWESVCKDLYVSCSAGVATKGRLEPLADTIIRAAIGMNSAKNSSGFEFIDSENKPKSAKPVRAERRQSVTTRQLIRKSIRDHKRIYKRLLQGPEFLHISQSRNFRDYWS